MGATALLFRGQRLLRAGEAAQALDTLGRAAERAPGSPHAALHRALALGDAGRLDEALEALARAAETWPGNPAFPLFRGALLAEADRAEEALAALRAALALSPGNLLAEAYLALVAMRRGDVEAPLRRLGAVGLTDNPRALAALLAEVEAALFRRFGADTDGKPPDARVMPDAPAGWSARRLLARGRACVERGDPVAAWPLLQLAARKNPSLPDLFAYLGFAAYDLGRYGEALGYLDRAGTWSQQPEAIHLHRGACLYKLGQFAEALDALRRAEGADELGDYATWVRLFLARTLVALGRPREAVPPLRRLVEMEGDVALARLRQARELLGLALPATAPQGYDVLEEGKAVLVVKPPCAETIREQRLAGGASPRREGGPRGGDVPPTVLPPRAGRAPMERLALPDGGTALVRQCRRGGLFGRLLGDRYLDGGRFLREIAVSDALRRRGIPTPEVIAGIRREILPGVYRAEIIVREVPESLDLAAALRRDAHSPVGSGHASRITHQSALAASARLVRQIHDAGLWHPDLNAKNILLGADGSAMILDLDRAELLDELPLSARFANLARLYRSLHKLGLAPKPVSDAAWAAFLDAYAGDDPVLLAHTDAAMARCRRDLGRHRLWWRVTG
ncbi:MAG TPA: lipopolysaccharide kinase InaA family protein [Planctomycetota bacterium]|nr:lipopolysaccharide kinase InaA family protein [Planctomycetota bacterium]HRR82679.1 lipopolysaccharide kinase InaA family protein [Planctomycetota bacterium]HRT93918.1 lipopolysaccharide kinase InaA family protein [Planctomycetota bacterium]